MWLRLQWLRSAGSMKFAVLLGLVSIPSTSERAGEQASKQANKQPTIDAMGANPSGVEQTNPMSRIAHHVAAYCIC